MNSRAIALSLFSCCALYAGAAAASPTRSFVLDSASALSEGKLDGTSVESDGSITSGAQATRTDLKGVLSAKSLLALPDGSAYVGTGDEGKIFLYRDGVAKLFADTKQLMVSSLARDARGTLYAGTLPKGKIFAISPSGQVREFASPEGAEHIWALCFDDKKQTLYAATGPHGKLFAIDPHGKAEVYYDSQDQHIMTLALADDGTLYAGTSDRALLVHVRGANRADVLYDFDASEVTALALQNGVVAVVANQYPKPTPPPKPSPASNGDSNSPHASTAAPSTPAPPQPAGKGQLFRVTPDGKVERLFGTDDSSLTTVEFGPNGVIYVGTGKDGHIHRVRGDHDHALFIDVDERQILATHLAGAHPMFVTGDSGAIYTLGRAGKQAHVWTSKALDAGALSRFGQLRLRARGPLQVSARSGNTDKPDATWSDWSAPLKAAGQLDAPRARFLQLKVELLSPDSVVYALEAFYLPQNQPALVTEIDVDPPRLREHPGHGAASSGVYKLHWKVENPDNDALRYRLFYAPEQSQSYRPLLREGEPLTATEHNWDTDGVADGYYRIRVEASDELDNPDPLAYRTHAESEPFLVDNHPPHIPELRVQAGNVIGKAADDLGPIGKLEYSVDGLDWKLVMPDDQLLDSAEERFTIPLAALPKGGHGLMVRASDARGNSTTRALEFDNR